MLMSFAHIHEKAAADPEKPKFRTGLRRLASESVEKLCQFILRRGGRTDFVFPPSQIAADMLSRRASSLRPPRSQNEQPHFFNRLLCAKTSKRDPWVRRSGAGRIARP